MYYHSFNMMYESNPILSIVSIALIITWIASFIFSFKVNSTIKNFTKISCQTNGHDAAQKMLQQSGIVDVKIVVKGGKIGSEYFNPADKTIYLSEECYYSNSISAVAIATHEAGHAVQLHQSDFFSVLRMKIARPVSFISKVWFFVIIAGAFFWSFNSNPLLLMIGLICFSASFIFQLVTLPVEFDASKRAINFLYNSTILDYNETKAATKVLKAAAWTYIIATIMTLLQLIRIILIILEDRR